VAVLAFLALRRSVDRAHILQADELAPPGDESPTAVLTPASVSGSQT